MPIRSGMFNRDPLDKLAHIPRAEPLTEMQAKILRESRLGLTVDTVPASSVEDAVGEGKAIGKIVLPPLTLREPELGYWDQAGNQ